MRFRITGSLIFLTLSISAIFSTSSAVACTRPDTVTIGFSWPSNSTVLIVNTAVPAAPLGTAIANWNTALAGRFTCGSVSFVTTGPGTGQIINLSYVTTIPDQCLSNNTPDTEMIAGTPITRGCVDLNHAQFDLSHRLSKVNMYINSQVTSTDAITEVVAHEITFALQDCNAKTNTNCTIGSSVMVSAASGLTINSLEGAPGPTSCDLDAVQGIATDYACQSGGAGTTDPCLGGSGSDPGTGPGFTTPGPGLSSTCSPIIIDTAGEGFQLTSAQAGVTFDITGTGQAIQLAWTVARSHNAFLALPGSDGFVHNGKELFGNFTPQPESPQPNGFLALAEFDKPENGGNSDGIIDERDAVFSRLRLWIDENHDGVCQANELHTLPELGVFSLALKYRESRRTDDFGNQFRYKAKVNPDPTDGESDVGRWTYDVFLTTVPNK